MSEPTRTLTFDARRKELTTTIITDSMRIDKEEPSEKYGRNINKSILTETGIRGVITNLNKEKNNFSQQLKHIKAQLEKIKDVKVDEAFLTMLKGAKEMEQKRQLEESRINAEAMIKEVNTQLLDIKSTVGNHIKF